MELRPIFSTLLRNKTAPLLIAAQVALTLAILCNAVFIINERLATAARPSGTDEANLFNIRFYPHRPIADTKDLQRRDLEVLNALPGVVSAAATNQVPLGQSGWNYGGLPTERGKDSDVGATYYFSGGGLIDTLGLRLVEGRDFQSNEVIDIDPSKDQKDPSVMIVTQALAKALYPEASSVVGKTFFLGGDADATEVTIVGVVERLQSPGAPAAPIAEHSMIGPIRWLDGFNYVVRTEPGQLDAMMVEAEKALIAQSRDRVLLGKRSFSEIRAIRYAGENMMAGLLMAVTAFLLLITASGIVGMASLWVNQRRKQIGVRRALGARRFDIVRYFLVENAMISSGGVIAGLVLALLLNDALVRSLEISRLPIDYLGVGAVAMWLLGLAAVLAPALRAAAVSPAVATRTA